MISLFKMLYGMALVLLSLIVESVIFGIVFAFGWELVIPRLFDLPHIDSFDGVIIILLTRLITFNVLKFMSSAPVTVPAINVKYNDQNVDLQKNENGKEG